MENNKEQSQPIPNEEVDALIPIDLRDLQIGYNYLVEFADEQDSGRLRFVYWKEGAYKITRAWKVAQQEKMYSFFEKP